MVSPIFYPGMSDMSRRRLFSWGAMAAGSAALTAGSAVTAAADEQVRSRKRYQMKKSINLWAFPYPDRMDLRRCLQLAKDAGFDGIELNYDLESELSPKSGTKEFTAIRRMAEEIGIAVSGLCSFLFWPYPLTSNDPAERARGMELAALMTQAAHDLGTPNLLVVPGMYTCRGGPIMIPRRTMSATGGLAKPSESCCQVPKNWACI